MKIPNPTPSLKPRICGNAIIVVGVLMYAIVRFFPLLIFLLTFMLHYFIPYCFCEGDCAIERRKMWNEFLIEVKCNPEYQDIKKIVIPNPYEVRLDETYWVNPRGMCLMTSIMRPAHTHEVKAVVCCCHGYSDLTSFLIRYEYQRLVKEDIAVISFDYEGHGRSDGEFCYIPNWNNLIEDASMFFRETYLREFPGKKCFLVGESMGGAVAYDVYSKLSSMISGVIFIAPMAKISEHMKPHPLIVKFLHWIIGSQGTERFVGLLPLAPSSDFSSLAYRLDDKRRLAHCIPIIYSRKPRLTTARELLLTTQRVSNSFKQFDAPFLVLHGLEDKITDPKSSQALYDESSSSDKQLKLYEGMFHTITSGESAENLDIVFTDIITWIEARL